METISNDPKQADNKFTPTGVNTNTNSFMLELFKELEHLKKTIESSKTNLKKEYYLKKLNKVKKTIISLSTAQSYLNGTLKVKDRK